MLLPHGKWCLPATFSCPQRERGLLDASVLRKGLPALKRAVLKNIVRPTCGTEDEAVADVQVIWRLKWRPHSATFGIAET